VRPVRSFPANSAKAISAFSFASPAATGVIAGTNIAVTVPQNTAVTDLVASFTTSGAVVSVASTPQTSGTIAAHDFTSPVTYTVTAADASTQNYTVTVTKAPLVIGDTYGGGKVAYILQPIDTGYSASVQKGLIAAAADQTPVGPVSGILWAVSPNQDTAVGTSTALGTGAANTDAIIAQNGSYNATSNAYAAGMARAYTDGTYHDWYLPSLEELNKLYISQALIGDNFQHSGSIPYWSSSEVTSSPAGYAYFEWFLDGRQSFNDKIYTHASVRAVRSFVAGPAGVAAQYIVTSSPYTGGKWTISAQLADAAGNAVATAGKDVAWSLGAGAGGFSSATTTTDASGIATVVYTPGSGTATVTATTDSVTGFVVIYAAG